MRNLEPLAVQLKERRIPFGIFYTADGGVTSDREWTQSAIRHFTEIESVLNLHPDTAIATDRVLVMGYHFPFPAIGHVVRHD
jgi:hypothetical protein